ncbi:hypothetical protein [Microbacterium sp. GXF6406]
MQITDEMVERACEAFGGIRSPDWEAADDWEKEQVREHMRKALAAALTSQAIATLQAEAWDIGFRTGQNGVRLARR